MRQIRDHLRPEFPLLSRDQTTNEQQYVGSKSSSGNIDLQNTNEIVITGDR